MNKYTTPSRKIPLLRNKKGINSITEMIEYSCKQYSSQTAYSVMTENGMRTFTFSEIYDYITRFASYLGKQGFGKGDHIALLSENRPEWGISFFAASWIGAVLIPLDARANLENHKFIIEYSSAKAIIVSEQYMSNAKTIKENCPTLDSIISMEDIDEIVRRHDPELSGQRVTQDDVCEILFTSGTTGLPKGVVLTHGNIMSNVEDIYSFLEIGPQDTAFSVLPIHHCYECTGGLLSTFYAGVRVHYARGLKPNILLEDLKMSKPTIWMNTPLILEKLYKRIIREIEGQNIFKKIILFIVPRRLLGRLIKKSLGLGNIRYIVSGGAALPDWVQNGLESLGFPLIQGYGLSESAPLISANPPGNPKNESVGMLIESVEARIVDQDADGNGEIYVKGPNIMKGYYKNPSETNEVLTEDGWLKTGDIGFFDHEGYLYITGRKKNVIVTKGGKNIFPEEIEDKMLKSAFIEEIMVFSPDEHSIHALVYPNLEELKIKHDITDIEAPVVHAVIKEEIREINKTMESYKRISKIGIKKEEFPKTTTNKIKRYLFKDINIEDNKTI